MDTTLSTLSVLHPIIFPMIKSRLGDRKDSWQAWQGINTYYFSSDSESLEPDLCTRICKLGIPFNISADSDRSMDGEDHYVRFSSTGKLIRKMVLQNERYPSLNTLEELKNDHAGLIYYINTFSESVAEPSWDNQIEYGRIYRARRLITG